MRYSDFTLKSQPPRSFVKLPVGLRLEPLPVTDTPYNTVTAYRRRGVFLADRDGETIDAATLRKASAPGSELTWTLVPYGSETRLGIDADLDGVLDGDEVTIAAGIGSAAEGE